MVQFDFNSIEVTPEWLTFILSKNGILLEGEVSSIEQEVTFSDLTVLSDFLALKVNYSPKSTGALPSRILMKLVKPRFYEIGVIEVLFYDSVMNSKALPPVVSCFGTGNFPETKQCYLLLEDHSDTHYQIPWGLAPTLHQFKGAISALAKIHAHWWDHPRFREPIFEPPEKWGPKWIQKAEKYFPEFVDFLGDRLSEKRKKIYECIFRELPDIFFTQFASSQQQTLIHGDAHFWNFLFPKDPIERQCLLIDWQSWSIGAGANDLAYMITLYDYPEHRQRMEKQLLQFYLEEMQRHGINYAWNNFWEEYRISTIWNLIIPIIQHSIFDVPPEEWGPNIENGFSAFEDLNCREFL